MRDRTIPTARDIMTTSLVVLEPETSLLKAMQTLTRRRISGAPVVDEGGRLVGILSEADCLRAVASAEFHAEEHCEQTPVREYMMPPRYTIPPETGIYRIAQHFLERPIRRLPVVDGDVLVGQVSRRDVLRGIVRMRERRQSLKRYPDYPAERQPML